MISFSKPEPAYAVRVLGPEGTLAKSLTGFEPRPEQLSMAHAVSECIKNNRKLAVEAGTGTGKSLAYLTAAVEMISQKKKKIIVSTYTINLQQQLINKDIPMLAEILDEPFRAVLAKGRSNYICLRRLQYALKKQRNLFDDISTEIINIDNWARQSEDGSLSDIPFVPSGKAWEAVNSEHGNCPGRNCRNFGKCFYRRARRELESADLIVSNHALLLSDLVLKETCPGILPDYEIIVFDEAHNLEHVAEGQLGISVSNLSLTYLLSNLFNQRTHKGILAFTSGANEAIERVKSCKKAAEVFFTQVQAWYEYAKKENHGTAHPNFVDDNITEPVRHLRLAVNQLSAKIEDEDHKLELMRYVDSCHSLEMQLKDFINQPRNDCVYWVERSGSRKKRIVLRSAPLDVGPDINRVLFDKYASVIMTSATLSCGGNSDKEGFEFFASRIGLKDYDSLRLGSPFDYQKQVKVYIEADIPVPGEDGFAERAVEAMKKYLLMSKGSAFVLFTSYYMMKDFAEKLGGWMQENRIELMVQGSGTDRATMLAEFKANHSSVLFGTDSFWQGVDVPGKSLTNVIIVRLPFAVPNHPLTRGRINIIRQNGGDPFVEYQLPTAIIRFKQGFGRLIRNKTDSGIVVVLDSRIVRKGYGRKFLQAIPKASVEIVTETD